MLEKATIARPYAEAAFSQALDEGTLSEWSVFLNNLKLVIADSNMRSVLNSPKLNDEQLSDFIIEVCAGETASHRNFIRLLVQAERIALAPEVSELFEHSKSAAEGMSDVEVISAYALDETQLNAISTTIAKRLGKKVEIIASEDKDLIGGVIIRAGDAVVDASVRGRLKDLTNIFAQ